MLVALALLAAMTDSPAPAPTPAAVAAVAKLGDDDFDSREAAESHLLKSLPADRSFVVPLIAAASGSDPEAARRADRVLRKCFDPVDWGAMGLEAPCLVDIAGERIYATEEVKTEHPDGAVSIHIQPVRLPATGHDFLVGAGRDVMLRREQTPGKPGWDEHDDPLGDDVQRPASVRLLRDMRAGGCSAWACKFVAGELEYATASK